MPRRTHPQPCQCGCGEETSGGHFRPGHDARLHSAILNHIGGDILDLRDFVELHTGREVVVGELCDSATQLARRTLPGVLPKRRESIGFLTCELIMDGLDDDAILEMVLPAFPKSGFKRTHIDYFRKLLKTADAAT